MVNVYIVYELNPCPKIPLGNFALQNCLFGATNTVKCNDKSKGDGFGINGSFGAPEKKFRINFNKASTKFCLSLHYNANGSYLFVNGKEIFKLKGDNKNFNFPIQFCLGRVSNGFSAIGSRELSLNGNVYDFSVDYNSIDRSDTLNIQNYLMTKNSIK